MPVPVTTSNPEGKGLTTHKNHALPSKGSLFSRLGADSATRAMEDKQKEQAVHWKERRAAANSDRQAEPASAPDDNGHGSAPAIVISDLEFRYTGDDGAPLPGPPVLENVSLELQRGSRMLLVGANGAGKTTLLKVLAGKHMVPEAAVKVLGQPPFHATHLTTSGALSYIGGNWERDIAFAGYSVPLAGDFPASQMLDSMPGASAERRRRLVEVLDIDETWRMHTVSDGQRRRVQIACGLMRPAQVLLLDEVDLDVLVREDLMNFLKEESEERGCCVVYITHIFDGIEHWPTHLGFLATGGFEAVTRAEEVPELQEGRLMELVEAFLLRHREARRDAEARGEAPTHPESKKGFEYLRNNGYSAGRLASTLK